MHVSIQLVQKGAQLRRKEEKGFVEPLLGRTLPLRAQRVAGTKPVKGGQTGMAALEMASSGHLCVTDQLQRF